MSSEDVPSDNIKSPHSHNGLRQVQSSGNCSFSSSNFFANSPPAFTSHSSQETTTTKTEFGAASVNVGEGEGEIFGMLDADTEVAGEIVRFAKRSLGVAGETVNLVRGGHDFVKFRLE